MQAEKAFGNEVDNEAGGVELDQKEDKWAEGEVGWEGGGKVGSTKAGLDHCVHSQIDPVVDSWEVDACVAEQEVYVGWEGCATFEGEEDETVHGIRIWKEVGSQNGENIDSDIENDVEDDGDVDSVDGQYVQVVPWTHHILTIPLNLVQVTYCFLPVPHNCPLIHLLHALLS